jgi:hypothetical protein
VEEIDLFGAAIALCQVAQRAKTVEAALKKLRKIGRDTLVAEQKLAAVTAQVEQRHAALTERESAIAAREAALDARAAAFESQAGDVRDELRGYYNSVAEEDRRIRYRILSSADLLHGYNARLQDLPSWETIRQLVVGLPPDPPPPERDVSHPRIDALSDTFSDPSADRHGNIFLGTLSRDVSHRGAT